MRRIIYDVALVGFIIMFVTVMFGIGLLIAGHS